MEENKEKNEPDHINNTPPDLLQNTVPAKTEGSSFNWRGFILSLLFVICVLLVPLFLIFWVPKIQNISAGLFHQTDSVAPVDSGSADYQVIYDRVSSALKKTKGEFDKLRPKQSYIIISLTENQFRLYDAKNKLVREGNCSTGSYRVLDNGKKQWAFKTPKGVRKVLSKTKDPVWTKPDWAFIEEGLPVPSARHSSRYEYGVLGDYALHMGEGYMIHGTIYQRFLGLAVTHGCVRLGDKDLKAVFETLTVGSKIYVY